MKVVSEDEYLPGVNLEGMQWYLAVIIAPAGSASNIRPILVPLV